MSEILMQQDAEIKCYAKSTSSMVEKEQQMTSVNQNGGLKHENYTCSSLGMCGSYYCGHGGDTDAPHGAKIKPQKYKMKIMQSVQWE
jgi:hypothetical protein